MTLGGVADNGIGILQQCQGQHQRDNQADEVAAAVGFLCSPRAAYITGATLHVNGGMYMS